jgi:hypothetical protein
MVEKALSFSSSVGDSYIDKREGTAKIPASSVSEESDLAF